MNFRFWFYLGSSIVIVGLSVSRAAVVSSTANGIKQLELSGQEERAGNIARYVERQTDEHKLVSLAKRLRYGDRKSLQIIIDRAYALDRGSPVITLLASSFHPELKERVLELDPLSKN